jgi:Restriction endonuclease
MEFTTRSEARAQGFKYFFVGEECKNGHISERMVESTQCIECLEERNQLFREEKEESVFFVKDKRDRKEKALAAREYERQQYLADDDFRVYVDEDQYEDIQFLPQTKKEALALGVKYYFTGKPCKRGHLAKRSTRGKSACFVCDKADRRRDSILYPEKRANNRHKRRSRMFEAGGSFTVQEINDLYDKQYGVCVYCPADLSGKNYHIDHIMPIVLHGRNSIENLQLLCPTCNHRKGGMHPDKWHAILKAERDYEKDIFDD